MPPQQNPPHTSLYGTGYPVHDAALVAVCSGVSGYVGLLQDTDLTGNFRLSRFYGLVVMT